MTQMRRFGKHNATGLKYDATYLGSPSPLSFLRRIFCSIHAADERLYHRPQPKGNALWVSPGTGAKQAFDGMTYLNRQRSGRGGGDGDRMLFNSDRWGGHGFTSSPSCKNVLWGGVYVGAIGVFMFADAALYYDGSSHWENSLVFNLHFHVDMAEADTPTQILSETALACFED